MRICSYEKCGRETRSLIKGLCPTCYARYQRNGTPEHVRPSRSFGVKQCSNPDCESTVGRFIKGLCRPCYQRQYSTGSVERQRVRNLCEIEGCDDPVRSHGLCAMHWQRYKRHGSTDAGRPEGWGSARRHPLYERWRSMRRTAKQSGGHVDAWSDFWKFLEDVGEAPSGEHRLYRIDDSKPYGPENAVWRERIKMHGNDREAKNRYAREWAKKRPALRKALYLKRHYGVSIDWYDERFNRQAGACAICGRPETRIDPRSGEPYLLAVDHDHTTGQPRQLLCSFCNHGLGNFGDDIGRLRAAIAYLERHAGNPAA